VFMVVAESETEASTKLYNYLGGVDGGEFVSEGIYLAVEDQAIGEKPQAGA